eukprot:2642028-Rhodomonas_salina.4
MRLKYVKDDRKSDGKRGTEEEEKNWWWWLRGFRCWHQWYDANSALFYAPTISCEDSPAHLPQPAVLSACSLRRTEEKGGNPVQQQQLTAYKEECCNL